MAGRIVSAIKIKKLLYADVLTAAPTADGIAAAIAAATPIANAHQDTFQYEETEPTVNKYKNQFTGSVYRSDIEEGEVAVKFSVGAYDLTTKAALQGGTATDKTWERGKAAQRYKCMYAITEDDICICFPKANVIGTGAYTDKAIAIAMQFVPQETGVSGMSMEYWFDVKA